MNLLVTQFPKHHIIHASPPYDRIPGLLLPPQLVTLENLGEGKEASLELRLNSRLLFANVSRSADYYYWEVRDVTEMDESIKLKDKTDSNTLIVSVNSFGMITNVFSNNDFLGQSPSCV